MSSQKGNVKRTRAQKHKNAVAFKNDRDDTTIQNKIINSLSISGCCHKCKEIVEWKIKYKKYKPLSQAKTCTLCKQKTVKKAYFIVCESCAQEKQCCAKCGHQNKVVLPPEPNPSEEARQQAMFRHELRALPEKKRRKFLRLLGSGQLTSKDSPSSLSSMTTMGAESDHESDDEDEQQPGLGDSIQEKHVDFCGLDKSLPTVEVGDGGDAEGREKLIEAEEGELQLQQAFKAK